MTMRRIEKNYSLQIRLCIGILVLFIGLFLTGTFFDKFAAEALFSPDHTIVKLITTTGVYPFHAVQVLGWGVIFQRVHSSKKSGQVRGALCTFCVVAAVFLGYIGGRSLVSGNNLGSIFPSFVGNVPVILIFSAILIYPLFFVGYLTAERSSDKLLARRVFGLLMILLAAYIVMEALKNTFDRPRYRTAVLGYEGITFVPWYKPFSGAEEYAAEYGLKADEFRSFPSGHSIFSSLTMCIFPSLSWLFPKLRDKQPYLFAFGFVFTVTVMSSRMILGAHYLSDVSAGAIIGVLSAMAFLAVQHRIAKNCERS